MQMFSYTEKFGLFVSTILAAAKNFATKLELKSFMKQLNRFTNLQSRALQFLLCLLFNKIFIVRQCLCSHLLTRKCYVQKMLKLLSLLKIHICSTLLLKCYIIIFNIKRLSSERIHVISLQSVYLHQSQTIQKSSNINLSNKIF